MIQLLLWILDWSRLNYLRLYLLQLLRLLQGMFGMAKRMIGVKVDVLLRFNLHKSTLDQGMAFEDID